MLFLLGIEANPTPPANISSVDSQMGQVKAKAPLNSMSIIVAACFPARSVTAFDVLIYVQGLVVSFMPLKS